jgi:branched-chain amino acid transport system substrate-binding protein
MAANKGKKPSTEVLAASLRGSEWMSPGGKIRMALSNGQQAIQDAAIGRTQWDAAKKMVVLNDIQRFDAECVNPPLNVKSEDWLKSGFAGAKCDAKPVAAEGKAADKKPAKK